MQWIADAVASMRTGLFGAAKPSLAEDTPAAKRRRTATTPQTDLPPSSPGEIQTSCSTPAADSAAGISPRGTTGQENSSDICAGSFSSDDGVLGWYWPGASHVHLSRPVRATDARIETARLIAVKVLALEGHEWTQEDQVHFGTEVGPAVKSSTWESTADMADYIGDMIRPRPEDDDPPSFPECWYSYGSPDQGCSTCSVMSLAEGTCPYCCDDCHGI